MRAGPLRDRLELQEPTESRASDGQVQKSWTTYRRPWGSIEPMRGREVFRAEKVQGEVTHMVRLRHRDPIPPRHRIKHGSRVFEITQALNPMERDEMTELLVVEVLD